MGINYIFWNIKLLKIFCFLFFYVYCKEANGWLFWLNSKFTEKSRILILHLFIFAIRFFFFFPCKFSGRFNLEVMETNYYLIQFCRKACREVILELNSFFFFSQPTEMTTHHLYNRSWCSPCWANNGTPSCLWIGC